VRIFWPTMAGVECLHENICVEKPEQFEIAEQLYEDAKIFVQLNITDFVHFIFCSTQSCFEGFGLGRSKAESFGTVTSVVGPNGWKHYAIVHEMIHHVQNEQLGTKKFVSLPRWFVEGMAYKLSEDPRELLSEPWESHRNEFTKWHKKIEPSKLWEEAKKL